LQPGMSRKSVIFIRIKNGKGKEGRRKASSWKRKKNMDLSGTREGVAEKKTVLRMHRATDVLSTLHNTALVVNSMTFEQNAAVLPYDGASRRDDSSLYALLTAPRARPYYFSLALSIVSSSRSGIFKRRSYAKRIALL